MKCVAGAEGHSGLFQQIIQNCQNHQPKIPLKRHRLDLLFSISTQTQFPNLEFSTETGCCQQHVMWRQAIAATIWLFWEHQHRSIGGGLRLPTGFAKQDPTIFLHLSSVQSSQDQVNWEISGCFAGLHLHRKQPAHWVRAGLHNRGKNVLTDVDWKRNLCFWTV